MRRTIMTVIAMVSLAAPSAALAHHGRHHHRHHHRHAHVLAFHAQAPTGATTTSPASSDKAGTIASFTNGVLTITLNDGSTVSGKVNEHTRIRCPFTPAAKAADFGDRGQDDQGEDDDRFDGNHHFDDNGHGECPGHDVHGHDAADHCTSAALVPGASVREAFLAVSSQGALWVEVKL